MNIRHCLRKILIIVMMAVLFSGMNVYAAGNSVLSKTSMSVTITNSDATTVTVNLTAVDGKEYLFLPSSADTKKLGFNYDQTKVNMTLINGTKELAVTSGQAVDISSYLLSAVEDGSKPMTIRLTDNSGNSSDSTIYVMQSSQIGAVFITSSDSNKNRAFVEKSKANKATGQMVMFGSKGTTVYAGKLDQIKARGNTTFTASKKPYQIKLDKGTDLAQTGNTANANKTWILLANAYDPTLIHNTAAMKLAASMGINAPDCVPVDLYYDGEYRGNYLLTEKVEVNKGRVEIHDLAKDNKSANSGKDLDKLSTTTGKNKYGDTISYVANMDSPADISGGYLIEQDDAYYKGERSYFVLSNGTPFVIKSPENCSKEEVEFISCYMEEALEAAKNGGTNPSTGKSVWDYIDKSSMAKYFVFEQIVKNADAFSSSAYFYLDMGGKLMAGPVWDFDDSYGIRSDMSDTAGIVGGGFITYIAGLADFKTEVKNYYSSTGYSKATSLGIKSFSTQIDASQKMNRVLWNSESCPYQKLATYADDIAYMQNFASGRNTWLKSEFASW